MAHWDSATCTKLRTECLGFIHIVFLFKVRAIMRLSTQMGRHQMKKNSAASSLLAGRKVAQFENDTASEK